MHWLFEWFKDKKMRSPATGRKELMNNEQWNWEETSSEKFQNLSAREVLEWMEEASQFMRKIYTIEDMKKLRELKHAETFGIR